MSGCAYRVKWWIYRPYLKQKTNKYSNIPSQKGFSLSSEAVEDMWDSWSRLFAEEKSEKQEFSASLYFVSL